MSEAELKTLKRIAAIALAGVGYLGWAAENRRAKQLERELLEERAKNSPWTERVEDRDDIQIGE
jgi:hypothetical protein